MTEMCFLLKTQNMLNSAVWPIFSYLCKWKQTKNFIDFYVFDLLGSVSVPPRLYTQRKRLEDA